MYALSNRCGLALQGGIGQSADVFVPPIDLINPSLIARIGQVDSPAAQAGEKRLRDVVMSGGFTRFRRATETPFNLIFEARP